MGRYERYRPQVDGLLFAFSFHQVSVRSRVWTAAAASGPTAALVSTASPAVAARRVSCQKNKNKTKYTRHHSSRWRLSHKNFVRPVKRLYGVYKKKKERKKRHEMKKARKGKQKTTWYLRRARDDMVRHGKIHGGVIPCYWRGQACGNIPPYGHLNHLTGEKINKRSVTSSTRLPLSNIDERS